MSWEHARCPECGNLMNRADCFHDETGRIVMRHHCPIDDVTVDTPEPDDNFQSRTELAAKEGRV